MPRSIDPPLSRQLEDGDLLARVEEDYEQHVVLASIEEEDEQHVVHWCHAAPGCAALWALVRARPVAPRAVLPRAHVSARVLASPDSEQGSGPLPWGEGHTA